jgi:hypothetical protein
MGLEKLQKILEEHKKWCFGEGGERANLSGADLREANLRWANLSGADLSEANLRWANLSGADISGANLSEADISEADISGANLSGADISGADISEANLRWANLSGADISGANLSEADLSEADISGANLSGADLSGANLRGANLRGANLREANLSEANLGWANLGWTNLSGAIGLLASVDFLSQFETTTDGLIAYKTIGGNYPAPARWKIECGSVIQEVVNPDRCCDCACGINVATIAWARAHGGHLPIWKVLIKWIDLADAVVPYGTDGKFRVARCTLLGIVKDDTDKITDKCS